MSDWRRPHSQQTDKKNAGDPQKRTKRVNIQIALEGHINRAMRGEACNEMMGVEAWMPKHAPPPIKTYAWRSVRKYALTPSQTAARKTCARISAETCADTCAKTCVKTRANTCAKTRANTCANTCAKTSRIFSPEGRERKNAKTRAKNKQNKAQPKRAKKSMQNPHGFSHAPAFFSRAQIHALFHTHHRAYTFCFPGPLPEKGRDGQGLVRISCPAADVHGWWRTSQASTNSRKI